MQKNNDLIISIFVEILFYSTYTGGESFDSESSSELNVRLCKKQFLLNPIFMERNCPVH